MNKNALRLGGRSASRAGREGVHGLGKLLCRHRLDLRPGADLLQIAVDHLIALGDALRTATSCPLAGPSETRRWSALLSSPTT